MGINLFLVLCFEQICCLSIYNTVFVVGWLVGWLVGCFGLNGPLRQYFSLYRAVSQREGEIKEK